MIIIGVTNLESVDPTTVTSANRNVSSFRDGIPWVNVLHSTLESVIF